jgi:branched-chain amino acid aminotransferase
MKEIDWANLSFGYMKTDYNVRINFRNGAWGELEISSSEVLNLHMAATCLHYGQEAFEGLKAFRGKDGKVRIFRLEENAARLQSTCQGIMMAELPTERFKEAILKVVKLNERFIPPYESGASLYIRPLLIGTSAQVGVHPADEYMFVVFVTPVGPYFKGGFSTNPYVIIREYDRAAPHGTGIYKVGGNYAASAPIRRLTTWVIPASSIWTQKRKNTLTNVVRPTSLVLKTIPTSLRSLLPSFLPSPIRA